MRIILLLLLCCGTALAAQTEMRAGNAEVQLRGEDANSQKPVEAIPPTPANATDVRYYGHGFLYLTTSSGVRIAFNPFPKDDRIGFKFPANLPADIILISAESPDISANEGFNGLPQVFRSLTGLGVNNANGIQFRGVGTYRDDTQRGNTVYVLELDRLVFCNLGAIGQPLSKAQVKEIGRVDVLFLPVGDKRLSVADLWKIVEQTRAKWVVPVMYRTEKSPFVELRKLEDFLNADESAKYPKITLDDNDYIFEAKKSPETPTLLIYQSP